MTDLTKPFEDDTIIDFGQFKGKTLEEVPAQYLLWWYNENVTKKELNKKSQLLIDYIDDNMDVLQSEIKQSNKHKYNERY